MDGSGKSPLRLEAPRLPWLTVRRVLLTGVAGAAVVAAIALAIARQGGAEPSILDEGISVNFGCDVRHFSDDDARKAARVTEGSWRRELRKRARASPRQRFANLAPAVLRARLRQAAGTYGFEVVSVDLLRPRQLAPKIVVRTDDYLGMTQALRRFVRRLDPKARTGDDRTGWRYEGCYFEAVDADGVPFVVVFNFWRGSGGGGGNGRAANDSFPSPTSNRGPA
jgi:hypothetical protein